MMPQEAQNASMAASSLATAPVWAGRGPSADRGAAAEQGDDRLLGGDRARHPPEALVVLDQFDIEQRRADLRPIAQPGEIILDAEMHGVADRDDRHERQRAGIGLVDEFLGERA